MNKQQKIKAVIQGDVQDMMERVMENVMRKDPFIPEVHHASKPLYAALVPDEIFKGTYFERRFDTLFGNIWEVLAVVVASIGLGVGEKGHRINGVIRTERLHRITEILDRIEHPGKGRLRAKPDWKSELAYVLEGEGDTVPVSVVCDVYAEDITNQMKYAFELKAPLPNSDQTKVSKEKILKLFAMDPMQVDAAYYALPYNPYGTRAKYNWSFPARWFNMQTDEVVLIGSEFWDKLGGAGTYLAFIDAINEIGPEYRARIYSEYLGIEPPYQVRDSTL